MKPCSVLDVNDKGGSRKCIAIQGRSYNEQLNTYRFQIPDELEEW